MMTKQYIFGLIAAAALIFVSCGDGNTGSLRVTPGESTGVTISAIGVEFDPHYFSQNAGTLDPESWEIVTRRVKEMGVQRFRIMVLPEWFEPLNDNGDPAVTDWGNLRFDSPEMESLYKVLDLAEQSGIEVTLVIWGCSTGVGLLPPAPEGSSGRHFLARGNEGENDSWVIGTHKTEEFCENFSMLVQYLVNEKKYGCITEITPINEPSYAYVVRGKVDHDAYVAMCRALDARFRRDGIRDRVRFNLSDDAENVDFLGKCARELGDIADLFNSHTYRFGYETPNSEIRAWEKQNLAYTRPTGKPHYIGEFGSNRTVGASRQRDIDLYERGVLIMRIALELMNTGASGVSYWSLLDQYYSHRNAYEQMQQLGLWRAKKSAYRDEPEFGDFIRTADLKEDYQIRPQYHAFSLLSRFVRPGAEVYPLDLQDEFAAGTAFRNADGKWTYFFANATDNEKILTVSLPQKAATGKFEIYRYVRDGFPTDDSMLPVWKTVDADGSFDATLPAESVVVYKQR